MADTEKRDLVDILNDLPQENTPRKTGIEAVLDEIDHEISSLDKQTQMYREAVAAGRGLTSANTDNLETISKCASVLQRLSHGVRRRDEIPRADEQWKRCLSLEREIADLISTVTGGSP